jgi:hypothetical protein
VRVPDDVQLGQRLAQPHGVVGRLVVDEQQLVDAVARDQRHRPLERLGRVARRHDHDDLRLHAAALAST